MEQRIDKIIQGDCLEVMKWIPDHSIDMILCDLPYGTTACSWDTIIPFEPLWEQYKRIIKDKGAIVLTASQPFTSLLITSNLKMFKYCWVWNKELPGNVLLAKIQPMKIHEDIPVFSLGSHNYYPIKTKALKKNIRPNPKRENQSKCFNATMKADKVDPFSRFPRSILNFNNRKGENNHLNLQHPTQKPVPLFEYLIQTYTQPGEIVLDNCIGSGTTAVAAKKTDRHFIGIELDPKYCEIARNRIGQTDFNELDKNPNKKGLLF